MMSLSPFALWSFSLLSALVLYIVVCGCQMMSENKGERIIDAN